MQHLAGVIQLVECQLPKLDVAGSSPVARSETHNAPVPGSGAGALWFLAYRRPLTGAA